MHSRTGIPEFYSGSIKPIDGLDIITFVTAGIFWVAVFFVVYGAYRFGCWAARRITKEDQ
jgi:hypothetical protein